jgi:hypothetical protein
MKNRKFNFKSKSPTPPAISGEDAIFLDLCHLNLIDAAKFAVSYSTHILLKNPHKKLYLTIKDEQTKKLIEPLKLKNTVLSIKKEELRYGKYN